MPTKILALLLMLAPAFAAGCSEAAPPTEVPENAILIGAALPFSGPRASTGIHLERALMLAIEDVNRAGGVGGRPLHLTVRDSNSGSDRGLAQLRKLLEEDGVSYIIGPEETNLAQSLVADIKRHDVLQILSSFTSPSITDSGSRGAWVRLVPSALTMGCALATKAIADGTTTTRTIAARDDYHLELASVFGSALSNLGGRPFPTITVASGESSYSRAISQVNRYQADATVMLAYPGTAATIIKEMARSTSIRWYFSPLLRDDALLWNVPDVLGGSVGVSPSLASDVECEDAMPDAAGGAGGDGGSLDCSGDAAARFARHYTERWGGNEPLQASHFYYDAIIMLALGLERAAAEGMEQPRPQQLFPYIARRPSDAAHVAWDSLHQGLQLARLGVSVNYVGAAGEYEFNRRGQNVRAVVDTWTISDSHQFVDRESVVCRLPIVHN